MHVKRFRFSNRQDAYEFARAYLNEPGVNSVELGGDNEAGTAIVKLDGEPAHTAFLLMVYGGKEQA